jgi:DNA transformation protein
MASRRSEFLELVLEQIAGVGSVRARAMFGGHGIYLGERMFAIVLADRLYLKADAATQEAFAARGLQPFAYDARGKRVVTSYYEAPAEVFEDPAAMREWAQRAYAAAMRKKV